MKTKFQILITLACAVSAHAGPRSSANYTLATETTDAGGTSATSAAYTHDGSLGGVAGISSVVTPAETAKHGYLGQLYEVTGLQLNSDPPSVVDEETTAQLAAWQELDDESFLSLLPTSVDWSTAGSFPLTVNETTGLATAAAVYEDTLTTVTATQGEIPNQLTAELALTVRDIDPDNFGSYAGDGLDDDWQFLYFGLNNPDNLFEFTAGLIPPVAMSRFLLRVEPVAGQPLQKRLVFSPLVTGRTYDILTSTTFAADSWDPLTTGETSDTGTERTVTDTEATAGKKFYRVQVKKP
jgi:hypothetical protein